MCSCRGFLKQNNFTDYNLNVLEYPGNICSYIDNLVRLNVIEIPYLQALLHC